METISLVIVVKNNPPHLFETLLSIDDLVSEIIIGNIDIGNDYKKRLSTNKKIKFIDLPSTTPFADLVKEDLKKQAKGDYILYLDPDEIFPEEAKKFLKKNLSRYDYYLFPRKNIIFGKWIEHSRWWPDYQLRLFKKNTVTWPKDLHPVPEGHGKEYKFEPTEENALLHYNYESVDQYIEKATRYAKSEAISYKEYSLSTAIKQATSEFISRYFAHDGYKDGVHGFVLATLQMFYYFLVYFYYWEKKKYSLEEKNISKSVLDFSKQLHFEISYWMSKKNLISESEKLKLKIQNIVMKQTK